MADMSRGSFNADGGFNVHVAGSSSTGAPADTIATGNLTAAQNEPLDISAM